jgi:circadian clock protein KaiB
VRRIIGDLSDRERVLIGLDLLYDELTEEDLADGAGLGNGADLGEGDDQ